MSTWGPELKRSVTQPKSLRELPPVSVYIPDRHVEGDCHCRKPLPSGRIYNGGTGHRWEACRLCYKLPRRPIR